MFVKFILTSNSERKMLINFTKLSLVLDWSYYMWCWKKQSRQKSQRKESKRGGARFSWLSHHYLPKKHGRTQNCQNFKNKHQLPKWPVIFAYSRIFFAILYYKTKIKREKNRSELRDMIILTRNPATECQGNENR